MGEWEEIMKLGVLYSGGKDSNYSAFLAKRYGHEIVCLITLFSENPESYMFQTQGLEMTKKQAAAMGIPQIMQKTKGVKEEELDDLETAIKKAIKEYGIGGVVTGAVESTYQASRVQRITNELGIECFNPLWQKDAEEYWKEMLAEGFKIKIVHTAAEGLGEGWVGRMINEENFEELKKLSEKHKFHLGFEGGEAETIVLWQPMFKEKIK